MIYLVPVVIFTAALIAGFLIRKYIFEQNSISKQDCQLLNDQLQQTITQKAIIENELEKLGHGYARVDASYKLLQNDLQNARTEISQLKAELTYKQEKLETQKQDLENIGQKFEGQFRLLANAILEDKAQKFNEQQENSLKTLLDPFKQNLLNFRQEFETKYTKESEDRISLREQVKHMMDLNKTLAEQATNLTQALRGQVKQQGNWGEMILESILEYSGLQKNLHYFVQERAQNDEGHIIQPDIIIRYPDDRALVIDSKVSLHNYERYCATDEKELREQALTLMIRSLKSHIDGLSAKSYHDVADALDFVIMFVPVEAAYITAMQADMNLWQYAYSKRVLLISPTNLIAAMKLVNDMWQRDSINKDAHKIAEKAGKLYEKLIGFVENFEKVGTQIEKAHATWQDAYKQLSKGKGNMISQAEQIKLYRANTAKSLPKSMVEQAMIEDDAPLDTGA